MALLLIEAWNNVLQDDICHLLNYLVSEDLLVPPFALEPVNVLICKCESLLYPSYITFKCLIVSKLKHMFRMLQFYFLFVCLDRDRPTHPKVGVGPSPFLAIFTLLL